MSPAAILALFAYSICKIEIQCSVIRRESTILEARDSTDLKNSSLMKKIENVVTRNKSAPPSEIKMKKISFLPRMNQPQVDLDREDVPMIPFLENENRVLISKGKNLLPNDNVGHRQPKFFGSLAFLTGLGAGSLATAASLNANALAVKVLSSAVPVPIPAPGYFTGFYGPQQYLPFSYPIFYPVPKFANNYENFANGIPVISSPILQQTKNATDGKSPPENNTNLARNDEANNRGANENEQESREDVTTEVDIKRTIPSDVNDDNIESSAMNEETELRQGNNNPSTTTTATTTTTTTTNPMAMNTTPESNVTVPITSWINATGSLPFYGYYGGSPQDLGHVILTTEDPQQRYIQDYHGDGFALPFERPAVFTPYQNAESYPSPFLNSFPPGEPYSEFLNTIDTDRYAYDSANNRNFNGFRPILK